MAEPASKTTQLVEEIEAYRAAGGADEFRLRRIKNQIESMKDADPASAFMLRGMLACLRDQPDEMVENHEKSRRLGSANINISGNYLSSLVVTGYVEQAEELGEELFAQFGESLLEDYFSLKLATGRIRAAHSIMPPENPESDRLFHGHLDRDDVRRWAHLFEELDLSDEASHEAITGLYTVMHAAGYFFHDVILRIAADGGDQWLSVVVRPAHARSLQEIQSLNDRLSEWQAERDLEAFRTGAIIARFSRPRRNNDGH